MIAPTVKTQAKGQNDLSRALKWGIVHLCSSNRIGDMIKNKSVIFYTFAFFAILHSDFVTFLQNCGIWKTNFCTYFIVTSKLLKLQRHTIPHFKALDQSFWPLAWVLTVEAITFVVSSKMSVLFLLPILYLDVSNTLLLYPTSGTE